MSAPFSKMGGGAPIRDAKGNAVTKTGLARAACLPCLRPTTPQMRDADDPYKMNTSLHKK